MSFQRIDIHQAKNMLDDPETVFLDFRDEASYLQGHIKDAILIRNDNVDELIKDINKQQPLVCYCYHGNSSQMAAEYFATQGFGAVYSMDGGFEAWRMDYPIVDNDTKKEAEK